MRNIEPFKFEYCSPHGGEFRYVCESCRDDAGNRPRAICRIMTRQNVFLCRRCLARMAASLREVERTFAADPRRPTNIRRAHEYEKKQAAAAKGG